MPQVDEGVMGILSHRLTSSEFGSMLRDELSGGGILIFEETGVALHTSCQSW